MKELLEVKEFLESRIAGNEKVRMECLDLMDEYERGMRIGIIMGYENSLEIVKSKIENINKS